MSRNELQTTFSTLGSFFVNVLDTLRCQRRRIVSVCYIATLPPEMVVLILEFFTIYEVARLQRFVSCDFRDRGQERIKECYKKSSGRNLYEEGMKFFMGLDNYKIDVDRGLLFMETALDAGCRLEEFARGMVAPNISDEEKQKILEDLKEIEETSPSHWVDYAIGRWYHFGLGGEENKNQAVVWYTKAKNGGNSAAMDCLGAAYELGDLGLTQSTTKANEFYALASEKGHSKARHSLGFNYFLGQGVETDYVRCVELWEQSAKQRNVEAQIYLSELYRDGSEDGTIPVNHPLHFKWALAAARQDHAEGQAYTATCYENGWGVEHNYASAYKWWMLAADIAHYYVGQYFELGKGRDIDLGQALFWYEKAAAQGEQSAIDAVERLS